MAADNNKEPPQRVSSIRPRGNPQVDPRERRLTVYGSTSGEGTLCMRRALCRCRVCLRKFTNLVSRCDQ